MHEIKVREHEKNPAKVSVNKVESSNPRVCRISLSLWRVCVCVCVLHNIKLDSESTTVKRLKKDSACTDAGVVAPSDLKQETPLQAESLWSGWNADMGKQEGRFKMRPHKTQRRSTAMHEN